ncbi:MAG: hypothetical protein B7X04_03675 [Parcubacteria group bacterium 21-54-25]|nr:MAG: hypothetical protein B7X04_03675 [Parcubacteria group bacterium 21-54-25]HQU08282.1 hypothetical protein [Candidatus Paceibacterota bacterium]
MRTTFSSGEIAELKKNPCVYTCTANTVYYTREFKQRALALQAAGVNTKEIWRRSGFNVSKWKDEYFRGTLRDWRKAVERGGTFGLKLTKVEIKNFRSIQNIALTFDSACGR